MDVRQRRRLSVLLVEVHPIQLQHLHLHSIGQAALLRFGVAPHKYSGVSSRLDVFPFDVQNEILIFARRSHDADRTPGADQQTVLHRPGVLVCVHVHPTCQVLPIEEIHKARLLKAR